MLLAIVPVALFLTLESPVTMVMFGGIAQALMLPIIGIGAIYLRHRRLPRKSRRRPRRPWRSGSTTAAILVADGVLRVVDNRVNGISFRF